MKSLTLLGNKILIEVLQDKDKGSIIIPEIAKTRPNFGIVRGFGTKVHEMYPDLKKGNRVLIKPYGSHQEIELNGKPHLIVSATPEYALCVVE